MENKIREYEFNLADYKNELIKGSIWYVDLGEVKKGSSIQAGIRPCIVVSNDMCDKFSPVLQVVALTSRVKKGLPTHIYLNQNATELKIKSIALCEQIISIDKKQIKSYVSQLENKYIELIDTGLKKQLQLVEIVKKEEFSIEYAQEILGNLNEFEQLYKMCKSKFVLKMITNNLKALESYCKKHDRNCEFYKKRFEKYLSAAI